MPFDGTKFEEPRAASGFERKLWRDVGIAVSAVWVVAIALWCIAPRGVPALAPATVPRPAPQEPCDIRRIPLGTPAATVRERCGAPDRINSPTVRDGNGIIVADQWVYHNGQLYLYFNGGVLTYWTRRDDHSWDYPDAATPAPDMSTAVYRNGAWEQRTPPGPVAVFRYFEDFYYDFDGGLVRQDHGTLPLGEVPSEYDRRPTSSTLNGIIAAESVTVGTVSSGEWLGVQGNTFVGTTTSSIPVWGSSGSGLITITTSANIEVDEITVNGKTQKFANGAWATFDGAGKMNIWPRYYHAEPLIAWHTVKETDYDAAGAAISTRVATHWYQGEGQGQGEIDRNPNSPNYCHPALMSNQGPPAELMGRLPIT